MRARARSTSTTRCSTARAPRTEVAIKVPIAASEAATTASATSTSMSVKPALPRRSECVARDNPGPSGEPVDANLVANAGPAEPDDPAAGHSRRQKADRRGCDPPIAAIRQYCIDDDIARD